MKKLVILLTFLLVCFASNATNYYISAAGNDANNGTSQATPWKTIAKLNLSTTWTSINPGDSILFRRGDTFIGPLIPGRTGTATARFNFGAYGTGAKPIITGFTTLSSWTLASTGIYQTTISGGLSTSLWLVTINGAIQRMGRFPNADSANGGYLTATSVNNTSLTITSTGLPTTINWTGANAIVKKNDFILDQCTITAQTTNTITYTNPPAGQIPTTVDNTYGAKVGYGFFIQNDIRTLDRFGEWYYNPTTKVLSVFFGNATPSAYTVKTSIVDTLINCGGQNGRTARNYLSFSNLAIEGGNDFGIFGKDNNTITITSCDFNANKDGINLWAVPNQVVQYCTFTNTLNNAIQLRARTFSGTTVRKNTISKCALFAGMGRSGDGYYNGIMAVGDNATIEYNRVDSIGFNGIQFGNTNQYVQYNYVTNFCMTKEDGGGIYIYNTTQTYTNRNITNNIVLYAIGNTTGTTHPTSSNTRCIYLDGTSSAINVLNNVAAYSPTDIVLMNSNQNVRLTGNIFYSAPYGVTFFKYGGAFQPLANITFTSNIVVPTLENIHYRNQDNPVTLSMTNDIRSIVAKFDSNAYRPSIQGMLKVIQGDGASYKDYVPFSLKGWQTLLGSSNELNSKITDSLKGYTSVSLVGANKTTNPTFDANITGTTGNPSGNVTWDNTSKITGVGSVKIATTTLDSLWSTSTSNTTTVYQIVGAVTAGKKYIAKSSTRATTTYGYARVFLQNSSGTTISNISYIYFDTAIINHEVLLTCTTTASSNARYVISFSKTQSPIYLDNYYLYEATATSVALSTAVNFQFNADSVAKTITLVGTWKDMKTGTLYTGSITLQPFTGVLLTLQPNSPLKLSRVIKANPIAGNVGLSNKINSYLSIYPNPTFDKVNLAIHSEDKGDGILSVVNMQGSTIYKQKLKIDLGKNTFTLNTAGLMTGEYAVNVKIVNNTLIDKFIKL
jgi:hypothetical protein